VRTCLNINKAKGLYCICLDAQEGFNRTIERWDNETDRKRQIPLAGQAAELLWAADAAALLLQKYTGSKAPNLITEVRMANSLRRGGHGLPICIQRQSKDEN
jgi:hypothetical protein